MRRLLETNSAAAIAASGISPPLPPPPPSPAPGQYVPFFGPSAGNYYVYVAAALAAVLCVLGTVLFGLYSWHRRPAATAARQAEADQRRRDEQQWASRYNARQQQEGSQGCCNAEDESTNPKDTRPRIIVLNPDEGTTLAVSVDPQQSGSEAPAALSKSAETDKQQQQIRQLGEQAQTTVQWQEIPLEGQREVQLQPLPALSSD